MSEPKDLVLRVLREIQSDLAAFRKEAGERLDKLETGQRNLRSATAGETVLSRMDSAERVVALRRRIAALKERVRELEAHK
jgi:polyhydroxyalkanoate synthesis regulator phasin